MKRSNDNLIYLQVQKYTKVLASIALLSFLLSSCGLFPAKAFTPAPVHFAETIVIEEVSSESAIAEEEQAKANEEEIKTNAQKDAAETLAEECRVALEEAEPALKQAEEAVKFGNVVGKTRREDLVGQTRCCVDRQQHPQPLMDRRRRTESQNGNLSRPVDLQACCHQ